MKREKTIETIMRRQIDYVPHNVELTSGELSKVADYLGIEPGDFFDWAGNHIEKISYNIGGSVIKPCYFRDEYGVVWNRSGLDKDIGVVDEILIPEAGFSGYQFPEPDLGAVRQATEKLLAGGKDTMKLGKIGMTYYERAWSLTGMENLLMNFLLEPKFVDDLFDRILQYNLKIIDAALPYDIDGFYFGDDYGQQTGMIMSPDTWRRFIKPGLKSMFERVKSAGKIVALHSCGNISDILPDLIEIGLDAYQTVQPEVYDLKKLKTEYGRDLTFWGAIGTQRLLPFAKPEELTAAVRDTLRVMSAGGGYIAAPTHQAPPDIPAENIVALVETLKGWNAPSANYSAPAQSFSSPSI